MTQRDRAWRRRVTRTIEHRHEEVKGLLVKPKENPAASRIISKPHQPGKLSPVQDARMDWHLRQDALDWSYEPPSLDGPAPA